MTKRIISMREFLRTGVFGPITTDLTLMDVAKTLGAPTHFVTWCAENIPTYWCYGKLELRFAEDAPHPMEWFQIEHAGELEGEFEVISPDFILSLEGVSGETKPSALLRAALWEPSSTIVNIGALADDVMLNICAGLVNIIFRVDSTFVPEGDALRYISESTVDEIIREIDERTEIDSIYSFPSAEEARESGARAHKHSVSGAKYLDAVVR